MHLKKDVRDRYMIKTEIEKLMPEERESMRNKFYEKLKEA